MRGLPGMFFKGMRTKTSEKKEIEKEKKEVEKEKEKFEKKSIKMTKMKKAKKTESEGRTSHFDDERKKGEVN